MTKLSELVRLNRAPWDYKAFLKHYDAYDKRLVARGFHGTSPKWRKDLEAFLRSGKRRWVVRAGRRAGKSSFWCRLSVVWALHGPWSVPVGDVGVVAFISIDRDEASARIRTIRAILENLGIPHQPAAEEIELVDRRCVFKVQTCSVTSVGFTAIMVVFDEMARWESRDSYANPARQVRASVAPSLATQPFGFEICSSSAWSASDFHCELVDMGSTDHQFVTMGPTWEYNSTIPESRTFELETDEATRLREYGNIPGNTTTLAVDTGDTNAAWEVKPVAVTGHGFFAIDASSLRGDSFAWIGGYQAGGVIHIAEVDSLGPEDFEHMKMSDVVEHVAKRAHAWKVTTIAGDQRESASLASLFNAQNLELETYNWSEGSKMAAFSLLKKLLHDRKIAVTCENANLKQQLLTCRAHMRPNGRVYYDTNGKDELSALLTLLHGHSQRFSLAAGETKLDLAIRAAIARGELFPNDGVSYQSGTPRNARQWEETVKC